MFKPRFEDFKAGYGTETGEMCMMMEHVQHAAYIYIYINIYIYIYKYKYIYMYIYILYIYIYVWIFNWYCNLPRHASAEKHTTL